MAEPERDGPAESVLSGILNRPALWDPALDLLELAPRRVRAAVVDHYDFVGNLPQPQFQMEVLDGGGDATLFVRAGITTIATQEACERWAAAISCSAHFQPVRVIVGMPCDLLENRGGRLNSPAEVPAAALLSMATHGMS